MIKIRDYQNVIKGISIDAVATVLITISGMLLIPYAIKILGAEKYGLWITINSLVSILGVLDLGIDQYLISIVASRQSKRKENNYWGSSRRISVKDINDNTNNNNSNYYFL